MHDRKLMASDDDGIDEPEGERRGAGGEVSPARLCGGVGPVSRNDVVAVARAVAAIVGNAGPGDTVSSPQAAPAIPVRLGAAAPPPPSQPVPATIVATVAADVQSQVSPHVPRPVHIPSPAVMRIGVAPAAIGAASGAAGVGTPVSTPARAQGQTEARSRAGGRLVDLSRWFVAGSRIAVLAFAVWLLAMVVLIGAYAFVNPPGSSLMALRWMGGTSIAQRWVPLERISPNLVTAVIVSEDGRFCRHWGIDPKEILAAIKRSRGGVPRGASTITMQLAKNLFLWPGKTYVRKVLEIPLTLAIELFWTKRRILEVYLNVVELGPGVFGVETAARHYFGRSAKSLSSEQASLLSVSLPAPLRRNARKPTRQVRRMARVVRARMRHSGYAARCVLKPR